MKKYIFFRLTIVTNILYHVNLLTDLLDGEAMFCVPHQACHVKPCVTLSHMLKLQLAGYRQTQL